MLRPKLAFACREKAEVLQHSWWRLIDRGRSISTSEGNRPAAIRPRPTAATVTMARPTANAKREFLPGCTSASPGAASHKAAEGLMGEARAPARQQRQPRPPADEYCGGNCYCGQASNLARMVCVQAAGQGNERRHIGCKKPKPQPAGGPWSNLSGDVFEIGSCANRGTSVKRFFGTGTVGDDCELSFPASRLVEEGDSYVARLAHRTRAVVGLGEARGRSCNPHYATF